MNINKHNYNPYFKRWKTQFSLIAELIDGSIILASEIEKNKIIEIAYNDPKENTLFKGKSNEISITKKVIDNGKKQYISNLQSNKTLSNSAEYKASIKCFYSLAIFDTTGEIFGALCLYSRSKNNFSADKLVQLEKLKQIIEDDIKDIEKSNLVPHTNRDTLLDDDEKYKQFFHSSPMGVFYWDTNMVITDCNEKFCEILKSNKESLLGLNLNLLSDKRPIPCIQSALKGVSDEYEGEYNTTTSKESIYVLLKSSPAYNQNNVICGGIGTIEDLSEKKQIQDALKASEVKYKDLVEKINDVIFTLDHEGICTYISPVITSFIGFLPEEIIGHHLMNFIHSDYKINFHEALNNVRKGSVIFIEIKVKDKNNKYQWIRVSLRPTYDNKDNYIGTHGVAQDIGETRNAESSLKESEEQFKLIATHISDIIYEWNPITDELIWHSNPNIISPTLRNIKSFSALNELIIPEDREKINDYWHNALNKLGAWKSEFKIRIGNNIIKYVLGNGIILFKGDIAYKGIGTFTDISKEKSLIRNLKHSNEKLEFNVAKLNGLLSVIPDMMFVFDRNGIIIDYHTNKEDLLFKDSSLFLNQNVKDVLPGEVAKLTVEKINSVLKNKETDTYNYELLIKNENRYFETRMVYVNQFQTLAIVRDVTEREQDKLELIKAKEKAEESDRLKSSFLANMSHEIRTPMNGIIGFSELLKSRTLNPEEREYYISVIVNSGKQLLDIINDVLEISKIETGQIELYLSDVNLNKIIQDICDIFSKKLQDQKNTLKLSIPIKDEESFIYTDESKLRQILTNLISNAVKFTQNGSIEVGYKVVNDNYIELFVTDTGIGIAKNEHLKIFERFAQANSQITKIHGGTGLGLSISQSLVEILGGKIWVDSEVNKGSKFSFSLPKKYNK